MKRLAAAVAALLMFGATPALATTSPKSLAKKIGCPGYRAETDKELFVREQGSCGPYTIYTFSGDGQKQWLKVAETFGGDPMVVGKDWIVTADTDAHARRVKKALGGKIA